MVTNSYLSAPVELPFCKHLTLTGRLLPDPRRPTHDDAWFYPSAAGPEILAQYLLIPYSRPTTKYPRRKRMEKIDVLVKGVPVPINNMFKGLCSLRGKSVSDGIIDAMISVIEESSGGMNENLQMILGEYRVSAK
jgi:hypothetical protein